MNKRINVHHVTRVEGHGNILVEVTDGQLKECKLEIIETPRFFEAMLLGRPYLEASHITSRICGICATGHATTSLRASEKALGIQISEQTDLLRKLTFHGEILDSHILHVYMLIAPDFLGVGSVIPLAKTHPDVVMRALLMKKLAGDICAVVTGRHTHPIAMAVGGFTHFPRASELEMLRQRLVAARADVDATVELAASLPWPQFERDTEYVSLFKPAEYAFIDREIVTSDGARMPAEAYRDVTNEYLTPHSSAKHTRHLRESYMVGALARFNNNYDLLHPRAKAVYRLSAEMLPTQLAELETFLRLWGRETLLLPVALYLDAQNIDGGPGGTIAPMIGHFLNRNQGITFMAVRDAWPDTPQASIRLEIAKPSPAEQRDAWATQLAGQSGVNGRTPALLTGQFNLNFPVIQSITRDLLASTASQDGMPDRLWRECLLRTRPRLEALAQRIHTKARVTMGGKIPLFDRGSPRVSPWRRRRRCSASP